MYWKIKHMQRCKQFILITGLLSLTFSSAHSVDLGFPIKQWAQDKVNSCIVNSSRNTIRYCIYSDCSNCSVAAGNGENILGLRTDYPYICRGTGKLTLVSPPGNDPFDNIGDPIPENSTVLITVEGYNSSATATYTVVDHSTSLPNSNSYNQCLINTIETLISRGIEH